jgi:CubicO group peptidase (beta-lactamase class C family)
MKKLFKFLKWFVLVIALICFGLWVTGYGYILRGLTMTYFVGQMAPGIDEAHSFYNDTVQASSHPEEWLEHENIKSLTLSETAVNQLEEINTVSFLVIQNNELLYERYWGGFDKEHPTNSFSAVKSLVSLLIGVAIEEGKIKSLDESVGEYLPDFAKDHKEDITIRNLLTMSSGLDWHESGANPFSHAAEAYYGTDLTALISSLNKIEEPGKEFNYQSGNTQILGFVLEAATGKSVPQLAEEKIWKKIGTTHDAYWNLDAENGKAKAFCCFYATPRDYAKIGQLILNKGKWRDTQVIPESYISESLSPAAIQWNGKPLTKYGLHWWILNYKGMNFTYARGIAGQYIISIPTLNIVIVRTGWKRGEVDENGHPLDIYNYIDGALELIAQLDA